MFSLVVVLLMVVMAVCLLYRYIKDHYQQLARDGIAGPAPSLLIGNLAEFANNGKDPLGTFVRLTQKYGKVFGYYEGWQPCIVVSEPDLMEKVLVKHFNHFDGRPNCWPFQHGVEGFSLQNLNGKVWKEHREVIASAFNTGSIRKMWPRLQAAAERYVKKLERKQNEHPEGFDVVEENESYSLEAFTSAAFDVAPDALQEVDRKRLLLYMRSTHNSASPENPAAALARVYPSLVPLLRMLDSRHRSLASLYTQYMGQKIRQEQAKMSGSQRPTNLLQHLLCARKKRTDHANNTVRSSFDLEEIQGMMAGLVAGGLGPASTALDFCLYCLAVFPDHQDTLLAELTTSLTCLSTGRTMTMEEVQGLQYLDMFVSECLRLYPVAPGVARTCLQDCVVEGVKFRKGTVVRLMGSVQYCDPHLYPDPVRFDPHRFSPVERGKRHPYSFLPFGSGPRMCAARRFGLLQVKLALTTLLPRFKVTACPLTLRPLPLTFKPFLCPRDGVWISLVPR